MSVKYSVLMQVKCDAKGCRTVSMATVPIARGGEFEGVMAAEMMTKLHLQGWRVRKKKNLCWLCAKDKR